jgi:hypothetical protein
MYDRRPVLVETLMRHVQQQPPPVSPTPTPSPPDPGIPAAPYIFSPPGRDADPQAVLRGARAQREELREQLSRLEERRGELSQQLRQTEGADRAGVERRIAEIDQRISEVDKQLATAELSVARSSAIPGAVVPDPPDPPDPDAYQETIAIVSSVFTFFVLFPLAIAYARRLWRRGAMSVAELPKAIAERLTRLDQAVDTIAIEVERISEGQRFLTKVMTDTNAGRTLGAGPAQPVEIEARDTERVSRSR